MLAITKDQRERFRYVRGVRRLFSQTFHLSSDQASKQNRAWEDWLALNQQECRGLRELLTTDVNDTFKARAIAILLAPRIKWAPFKWSDTTSLTNYLSVQKIVLADLSPKLYYFVLELLELNVDEVLRHPTDEELSKTLLHYNGLILQALELLGENHPKAASLFGRYQINDPIAFWTMDDASGYNPLLILFGAKVPEKWKWEIDKKMREVIRAEQEGRSTARAEHEDALAQYVHHIQNGFYRSEGFPYSAKLFASQLTFVLEPLILSGKSLFSYWHAGPILEMLKAEEYKDLRYRFARYIILIVQGDFGRYRVTDQKTLAGAQMMLEEFGEADPVLRARLETLIAEGEARTNQDQASAVAERGRREAVMAAMK